MSVEQLEALAAKVDSILDRIDENASDRDLVDIRGELTTLRRDIPRDPEFAELLRIVDDARDDIRRKVTAAVVARMEQRSAELTRYVQVVKGVTAKARKDASDTRLEVIRQVATQGEEAIKAARAAKDAIGANDLATAASEIEKSIAVVTGLITQLSST